MASLSTWSPIVLVVAFLILAAVAYFFRSRGEARYKEGTAQTQIFLAGEEAPEPDKRHIRAHNMYWGFFQALKRYYETTMNAHTGIINDYIIWFTSVVAITAVIVFIAGMV